jgi:hypothetical protein
VAVFRGETIDAARLVAVSIAPDLVADVAARLLADTEDRRQSGDPVVNAVEAGRRRALAILAGGGDA